MKREYLYAGGAVAALVVGYLVYRKFGNALATTLNPASDQNAAYTGINALGRATGLIGEDDSLGTAIYGAVDTVKGWLGFGDADRMAAAGAPTVGVDGSEWFFDYSRLDDARSSYPIVPTPAGEGRRPGVNVPRFSKPY